MRTYRRYTHVTQADVTAAARAIQAELSGLPFTVAPNRSSHRTECTACGWSKCGATVQEAKDHARTH